MKFGQQLEVNTFPEWSKHYVRYRQLKNAINELFPTPTELADEARTDGLKSARALLKLTNPSPPAARRAAAAAAAKTAAADTAAKSASQSSDEETASLLSPSASSSALASSVSPPDTPPEGSRPLEPLRESLAINTNTRDYGGLEDEPLLSVEERKRTQQVQLQNAALASETPPATNGHTLAPPADKHTRKNKDASTNGNLSSHIGRSISRPHFATAASVAHLRASASSAAHHEKVDAIVIKILAEVQKVDEFHRANEAKILATFEGIRRQAEEMLAQKHAQPKQEPIMKRLKQLKRQAAERYGRGSSNKTMPPLDAKESAKLAAAAAVLSPSPDATASVTPASSTSTIPHSHSHPHLPTHFSAGHTAASSSSSHSRRHSLDGDELIDALPLRGAFIALLRRATMLIHYVDINYVAFLKLLKVFEKRTSAAVKHLDDQSESSREQVRTATSAAIAQLRAAVQGRSFYTSRALDATVLPEVYRLFSELFEHGNLERGKLVLLSTMTEQQYNRTDAFWLGIKVGVIMMLLALLGVILVRPVEDLTLVSEMGAFAPVYRCIGLLICFMWLWSFLVYIWDKHRIPYVLIFQLNPRTRLTHFQLQTEAANLTIVYLFNSLLFLTHAGALLLPSLSLMMYPLALFLYVLIKFFTPSRRVSNWTSRAVLLRTLGQIVIAPFGKIRFIESFVADILTSMVKIFVDVEASTCIFVAWTTVTRAEALVDCAAVAKVVVPIICALPLWWRFLQCLRRYYDTENRTPHVPNAIKYLITHSVVIMVAYHPIFVDHHASGWQTYRIVWLCCCIGSTLYTTWWDLVMDWGLLTSNHPRYPLLRAEIVFTDHVWFYYFAMVSNALLRWVWVITIIPFSFEDGSDDDWTPSTYFSALISYDQIIVPVLGILELVRRFQWSILRVEYEQITQGTHLRVDAHLPVFIQQLQKTTAEKTEEEEDKGYGILTEVLGMVVVMLLIAVVAAKA